MRNAEPKELVPRTSAHIEVYIGASPANYPDLRVNDGRTVTRISWAFNGGALDGQPVLKTLSEYLQQVTALLDEAERRLVSRDPSALHDLNIACPLRDRHCKMKQEPVLSVGLPCRRVPYPPIRDKTCGSSALLQRLGTGT
jgi:hypothetical protein